MFPNASYLAKGDDDMFLRVPQYLADLRTLPRHGLYWGLLDHSDSGYVYISGFCTTLGRDVVEHVVSYEPVRNLVYNPYCITRKELFLRDMDHEDVMVAQIIYKTMHRHVVYAREKPCHFHDVHVGFRVRPVTSRSVAIHHLWESEYAEMMERFGNDTSPSPRRFRRPSRCFIRFPCNM
ncbi:putative UDP-Gal or UDP-GlcNAc-dependent glycosyltransferase [Trypanosoma theileri]|uniref:Putative UDP-Gal or UDP-GlcNAc-dependent glycosyltransferase n=1 Tax=Trypanosoma theileri TaxID=67003 RepID=A0A1X0NEP9_9TRYP|nr:putative UDP-Gal or UDP-GlcNAc-dependent glycosyltransferase [Trypanosoma theileri]ORC80250.1 putative UDP-Gal or UDP-GlcNAc-dependent glycosyltransferase [Trypanosoma theileri]